MIHLNIVVEGQTEEAFVKDVLSPHLAKHNVAVYCQLTHTGGTKTHPVKGGVGKTPKYQTIKRALERWMRSDRYRKDVYYTTFIDLYAFPKDDNSPYSESIQNDNDKYRKIERLEKAIEEDIDNDRFIGYVQLHEFETFLLIKPELLSEMFPKNKKEAINIKEEVKDFSNVELINDTETGAPSKRIIKHIPQYDKLKRTVGPLVAEETGLPKLRDNCKHFDEWLSRLENLSQEV